MKYPRLRRGIFICCPGLGVDPLIDPLQIANTLYETFHPRRVLPLHAPGGYRPHDCSVVAQGKKAADGQVQGLRISQVIWFPKFDIL